MSKTIIPCICMTCGVRNNLENPTESGYCVNGHDNWLEYRDVMMPGNQWVKATARKFGLTEEQLREKFLDTSIKQL